MELFAMAATVAHARRLLDARDPDAERAIELADLFCQGARRRVQRSFKDLWRNADDRKNRVAARVMKGEHAWLETGHLPLALPADAFKTHGLTERRAAEKPKIAAVAS